MMKIETCQMPHEIMRQWRFCAQHFPAHLSSTFLRVICAYCCHQHEHAAILMICLCQQFYHSNRKSNTSLPFSWCSDKRAYCRATHSKYLQDDVRGEKKNIRSLKTKENI
ncbi:uncharacterized protein RHO17_008600 isoform 1-T1 [Thomomys bottae]